MGFYLKDVKISKMKENCQPRINIEPKEPENFREEKGNSFPEIIANPPLENTTLVYSVPVMGEWYNGNTLRMLKSMFSQRTYDKQAFEVELVTNIGGKIDCLLTRGEKFKYIKNEQGDYPLKSQTKDEVQNKTNELLDEMNESIGYLRKVVKVQDLARKLKNQPEDKNIEGQLNNVLTKITNPLQREIVELAIKKSDSISLTVVDGTYTVFDDTDYFPVSFGSLRTLGADVVKTRYEGKEKEIVLGLFDADTILEDSSTVKSFQNIFQKYPDLNYMFAGMTTFPIPHSVNFLADSPRQNLYATWSYNKAMPYHGSPQILFKMKAYDKLQELAGWDGLRGFHGDEDIDTCYRLIYHFGELQKGLLLESSCKFKLYPPTVITADRLDGNVDSAARKIKFSENGTKHITSDIGFVLDFKEHVMGLIDKRSDDKKLILDSLKETRIHYEKQQKKQQRVNRLILKSFVEAIDNGFIKKNEGNEIEINQQEVSKMMGGGVLQDYINFNKEVASSIMSSPDDLQVIRYFLGNILTLPDNIKNLTPFQLAIREYVGEVLPISDIHNGEILHVKKNTKGHNTDEYVNKFPSSKWEVEDIRSIESKVSLMHTLIAENLALGHIYKVIFETDEFIDQKLDDFRQEYSQWPGNRDKQGLGLHFGNQQERIERMKNKLSVTDEIRNNEVIKRIKIRSFPMLGLFKRLTVKK